MSSLTHHTQTDDRTNPFITARLDKSVLELHQSLQPLIDQEFRPILANALVSSKRLRR